VRSKKADPNRTWFVAGGNLTNYPYKVATPTAEMLVAKILFNSVTYMPGACFVSIDISNFYLMTPLLRHTFASKSPTYLTRSSINTNSTTKPIKMATFISPSCVACMVYLSPAY
jgi:hypothetical protein